MALSDEVKRLQLPLGPVSGYLLDPDSNNPIVAAAARFAVGLPDVKQAPDAAARTEMRGTWLRTWQGPAGFVVGSLFSKDEHVDVDAAVRSWTLVRNVLLPAARGLSAVAKGQFSVYQVLNLVAPQPVDLAALALKHVTLYAYRVAIAGIQLHEREELLDLALNSGRMSVDDLNRDYILRCGALQAIVAVAKTGVYDSVAEAARSRDKQATSGLGALGVGTTVLIAIAVVAVIAGIAFFLTSITETAARNELIREITEEGCKRDPKNCVQLIRELGERLAKPPPDSIPLMPGLPTSRQFMLFGLGAVAIYAAFHAIPGIIDASRSRR